MTPSVTRIDTQKGYMLRPVQTGCSLLLIVGGVVWQCVAKSYR